MSDDASMRRVTLNLRWVARAGQWVLQLGVRVTHYDANGWHLGQRLEWQDVPTAKEETGDAT